MKSRVSVIYNVLTTLAIAIIFDDFIAWYPEKGQQRYELHDGVIVKMPPH